MATAPPPRIHTLDGWRAVAILLVIAGHGAHFGQYKDQLWANLWGLGVDIFFVLSGYIITLKFIQEKEKSSTINLNSFYIRRAFRILPLVCAYLGTLCVVSLFVNLLDFHSSEVFGSLFFFRNYQLAATQRGFYTTHFWSLSIEEHFYLVWPALFLWLGNRRSLWFAGIGACTCAAWRLYDCTHPDSWIGRYLPGPDSFYRQIRTDARFDGLLLGCALAILLSREPVRKFVFRNFPKEAPLFAAVLLGLNIQRTNGWPTLSSYLIVLAMVGGTLVVEEGLVHKGLNSRVMVWIGTVSYSAYIWQEMFMTRPASSLSPFGFLAYFPYNLICVFAVSALSYYLVERPCIEQGRRLLKRRRERAAATSNA